MSVAIKKAIIRGARYGFNIPELAIYFTFHKDKITHNDYLGFCKWAKGNENFYYWLRKKLNAEYR